MPCMCGATDCRSCGPAQGYRYPPLTDRQECEIEDRAGVLLEERLYTDQVQFDDLLAGIDASDYQADLQKALASLNTCRTDCTALNTLLDSLTRIDRLFRSEAERVWLDELRTEAEAELIEA